MPILQDKISVVIPIYNAEGCLEKAINSVINQSYKNIEIILVDDGSTDNSGDMCDYFSKINNNIKVIHQNNKGLSAARNAGVKASTGKYIGFVDADDWIAEDMYEILYKNIVAAKADIACCEFVEVRDGYLIDFGTNEKPVCHKTNRALEILLSGLKYHDFFWNKLYRRELLISIEQPEGKYFEDIYTMEKLFSISNKVVFVDKGLYFYNTINNNSITNNVTYKIAYDYLDGLAGLLGKYFQYSVLIKNRLINAMVQIKTGSFNNNISKSERAKINMLLSDCKGKYFSLRNTRIKQFLKSICVVRFGIVYKIKYKVKESKIKLFKNFVAFWNKRKLKKIYKNINIYKADKY